MAGMALAGAALFLVATDGPGEDPVPLEGQVRQQAQDLLDVLAKRSAPDNASANLLAHEIAYARQGDPGLRNHVDRYFPHEDWSLVTRNEDGGVAPVASSGDPGGVVTTGSRPLVPGWTYSWEDPLMEVYSGDHPMGVASVPVHDSRTGRLDGEPVKVTVTVEEGGDEKEYHVYETVGRAEQGEKTATLFAENVESEIVIGFSSDYLTNCEPLTEGNPSELRCELTLRFEGLQAPSLDSGTILEIDVPRAWRYLGLDRGTGDWNVLHPPVNRTGPFTFEAQVREGASVEDGDELSLALNVTTNPTAPFSTFEARLANGTLSRGEIVVPHPGAEAKAPRAVYTSIPYPGVAGGTERWGIGFSNGLSDTTVTGIAVESFDGTPLFEDATARDRVDEDCDSDPLASCGEVQVSPDGTRVTWSGRETVLQGETRDLILDVAATEATTNVSEADRRTYPEVHFDNGYVHRLTRQTGAPGVYTDRIPPEADVLGDGPAGYPTPSTTAGIADDETHTFDARLDYWPRGELWKVDSNFTYTVAPGTADELVLDTRGAVSASRVETTPSTTTTGGVVWAHVNASNVLTEVAAQDGQDVEMTARLYSPPTLANEPAHEVRTNLSGEAVGEPVTDVLVADVTGDGGREAVLGAEDGQVHAYEVDATNLQQVPLWGREVAGTPTSLAAGVGGDGTPRIHAGSDEGTVTALTPAGGTSWTHDTGGDPVDALHPWRKGDDGATDGLWVVRDPRPGAAGGGEGLQWSLLEISHATLTPAVTTAATGDEGGVSGVAAPLGTRLATAVAGPGPSAARVNVTWPDGTTAWSRSLGDGYEEVASAASLDADGDGGPDLAVALLETDRAGHVVLLDGADGSEMGRFQARELARLAAVGDATDAPGEELAFATQRNRVGVLEERGGALYRAWARDVVPEQDLPDASAPFPETDASLGWTGCGRTHAATCILQQSGEAGGIPPRPVGLDVVGRVAADEGPVLAFTYSRGFQTAGSATGTVVYHDLDDGDPAGASEVPPTAGTPVAADGDRALWLAVGTDRGHLVTVDAGPVEARQSQVAADRSLFHLPVVVGEGAYYGTYVVDVEIAWSPAGLADRQSVHLVSRFAVQPATGAGPGGFVYDTKLNLARPAGR